MRIATFALIATFAVRVLPAQDTTCTAKLNAFKSKTEEDYAGFRIEVTGKRLQQYSANFTRLAADAQRASGEACFFVLDRYIKWFSDPHLFVFQNTALDTAETTRRARAVRTIPLTESELRADFAKRMGKTDPIEGVWYDGAGLRVGVIPDTSARGHFLAVVLTSDTSIWPAGGVRAAIERQSAGKYLVYLYSANYSVRHLDGVIHKEALLRLSPGLWAREFPAPPVTGLIDAKDPHLPTLVWRGGTAIVSITSHNPAYKAHLDSLVAANDSQLRSAPRLIVDLRGNEGGASFMSNALLPFIQSATKRAHRYQSDSAYMLSTPDQIAYARRSFGSDTSRFVRTLVSSLTTAPGQLVTMPSFANDDAADTLLLGPSRVGIITDRGTVSASEVLVLKALSSTRARVFGQPTSGALDYPSANVVSVMRGERRWYLGYPAIASNKAPPKYPMRGVGIAPDVSIPVASLLGTILDVERRLGSR